MKRFLSMNITIMLSLMLCQVAFASSRVRVKGHATKRGSYVNTHYKTKVDKSKRNNWSSKGNTNPYTGKGGTKDPDKQLLKIR